MCINIILHLLYNEKQICALHFKIDNYFEYQYVQMTIIISN